MDLVLLVPLWIGAPYILHFLFGASFVPATQPFRWLLLAAAAWGLGSIVISGLRGFGHPGLSTMAKFTAAIVTAVALVTLLPRYGITGAAVASLIGYTTMLAVALVSFIWKRRIRLRDCLVPQRQDILMANWTSVRAFVFSKAADS
jgi:O-antigen/teichoic acid export membrane protein